MAHVRLRFLALLFIGTSPALVPPAIATAQLAAPAAAAAMRPLPDTAAAGRRVRSLPVTMGGALGGGLLGGAVGAGLGALAGTRGNSSSDSALGEFIVGTAAGATIGYGIGAGVGAHLAASTAPRPGIFPTLGVSFLGAATGALVAIAIDNASGREGDAQDVLTVVTVPIVHITLTSMFARWRARTAP